MNESHLLLWILTGIWFTQYNLILKLQHTETQLSSLYITAAHPESVKWQDSEHHEFTFSSWANCSSHRFSSSVWAACDSSAAARPSASISAWTWKHKHCLYTDDEMRAELTLVYVAAPILLVINAKTSHSTLLCKYPDNTDEQKDAVITIISQFHSFFFTRRTTTTNASFSKYRQHRWRNVCDRGECSRALMLRRTAQ